MADPLDLAIGDVLADRLLFDWVVRAIQLDLGTNYVESLDRLYEGADSDFEDANGVRARMLDQGERAQTMTLAGVLERARVDADYVTDALQVLERRSTESRGKLTPAYGTFACSPCCPHLDEGRAPVASIVLGVLLG
jgi:hypothetical protein